MGLTEQWDWPGATASPVRVCKRATCPAQVADSVRVTGSPTKMSQLRCTVHGVDIEITVQMLIAMLNSGWEYLV